MELLKKQTFPGMMLKLFILFSLFCPFVISFAGTAYSPDIVLVNVFGIAYILYTLCRGGLSVKGNRLFSGLMGAMLLVFNGLALYVNMVQQHWYAGQGNVTVSFLFFLSLVLTGDREEKEDALQTMLMSMGILVLIGMIPYFFNFYGFSVLNGNLYVTPMEGQFDERRYNWLYLHKSEYAFLMVLLLALAATYRDRYKKKWMYWATLGILAVGLVISNTRATMVAALCIFGGLILDTIRRQPKKVRIRYWLCLIPVVLVGAVMLYIVSRNRDLLSLGSRTYIWGASVEQIMKNPLGLGTRCGLEKFKIPVWPKRVYNCHNVFLNILLQFSLPAGGVYVAMLLVLLVVSVKRKPSFLTLGIWAALLIPMCMDWCLLLPQLSLFLLGVYYLFFHEGKKQAE